MLRRFTQNGSETWMISGKLTTIGSADTCDIFIERKPSLTSKLVTIDANRDLIRPNVLSRATAVANGRGDRAPLLRGHSLDRSRHRRRRIANAWTAEKASYNINSPESSGSGSRGLGLTRERSDTSLRPQSTQIRYMQQRIGELEAALRGPSSDSGIAVEERNRYAKLMERIRRLESELAQKNHLDVVSLRDEDEGQAEDLDATEENINELKSALEKSEREKAELRVNFSKARQKLKERNDLIGELVAGNQNDKPHFSKTTEIEDFDDSFIASKSLEQSNGDLILLNKQETEEPESPKISTSKYKQIETALEVQRALSSLLYEDMKKIPKPDPNQLQKVEDLLKEISRFPLTSWQEKMLDYEVRMREMILKMQKFEENDMGMIDQQIGLEFKGNWAGLFEAAASWFPVLQEMAHHILKFAKAREAFSEWTVELREAFYEEALSSVLLYSYSTKLAEKFSFVGLGDHWLLSCLVPMLRAAAKRLQDADNARIENRIDCHTSTEISLDDLEADNKRATELQLEISRRDENLQKFEAELEKAENEKKDLNSATDELQSEVSRIKSEYSEARRSEAGEV